MNGILSSFESSPLKFPKDGAINVSQGVMPDSLPFYHLLETANTIQYLLFLSNVNKEIAMQRRHAVCIGYTCRN
jgi:hypothetical protein